MFEPAHREVRARTKAYRPTCVQKICATVDKLLMPGSLEQTRRGYMTFAETQRSATLRSGSDVPRSVGKASALK